MNQGLVAVVDDESRTRGLIRSALEAADYQVIEAGNGQEALALLDQHRPQLMILDVRMPVMTGLEALPRLLKKCPELIVLFLTAYVDIRDAVELMKQGARDYLEKPIDLDELVTVVNDALGRSSSLSKAPSELPLPDHVIARSPSILAVYHEAYRAAQADVPVLIGGECGTGKEVLAGLIHDWSPRRDGPFEALNCAALPEQLIESELFGHVKGAFTGAIASRQGRFELASGGSLLLDELGEMPLSLQAKLLRVLEQKRVRKLGDSEDRLVDARVIAATNVDLDSKVAGGEFREDLLYRLNVIPLTLPPLRQRPEDILLLAEAFLKGRGKKLSPAAQRCLLAYSWPGNVRELKNTMARAAILAQGSLILPADLPTALVNAQPNLQDGSPKVLIGSLEEIQKQAILEALEKTGGNRTHAAKILDISRRNLIYKLKSYGL